jgi:transcriptional regulator with XRE-family HTH domain
MPLKTGRQLTAARVLAGWSQAQLATKAGLATNTVQRAEGLDDQVLTSGLRTLLAIETALAKVGVECFLDRDGKPGVKLR